jgi:hypothetical protein
MRVRTNGTESAFARSHKPSLRHIARTMTPKDPAKKPDLDPLNFEPTDLMSARSEYDRLPPGVAERGNLEGGYWESRRRRALPTDRALTGTGLDWMVSLPPAVRPKALNVQFPRIANTIAEVWPDLSRAHIMIDRLLHDDRGGTRSGFPEEVRKDLAVLARYVKLLQARDDL